MDDLIYSGWISALLKAPWQNHTKKSGLHHLSGEQDWKIDCRNQYLAEHSSGGTPHDLHGATNRIGRNCSTPYFMPCTTTEQHIVHHLCNVVLSHTTSGELKLENISTAPAPFIPQCNSMFTAASACLQWTIKSCRERGSGTAQNKRIAIKRPVKANFSQATQYSKKRNAHPHCCVACNALCGLSFKKLSPFVIFWFGNLLLPPSILFSQITEPRLWIDSMAVSLVEY